MTKSKNKNLIKGKNNVKDITVEEFDRMFDNYEDITPYLDFDKAVVIKRVNVDFPLWMIKRLDQESVKLNVSRQAIIKMWINDRMEEQNALKRKDPSKKK